MEKILLINSSQGEDYIADLMNIAFICQNKIRVDVNHKLDYLYDDFDENKRLYGRGFTVYRTLDKKLKKKTTEVNLSKLNNNELEKYKNIIITSIWRQDKQLVFRLTKEKALEAKLILIDGEDHRDIYNNMERFVYYKREMDDGVYKNVLPISIKIPPQKCKFMTYEHNYIPEKKFLMAQCDPRNRKSYVFETEDKYYRQYAESYFGITTQKGGWDCLRHYEILANHCLPVFPDIKDKPRLTMNEYPTELQEDANRLYKEACLQRDYNTINFRQEYKRLMRGFLEVFYNSMLTNKYVDIVKGSDQ